MSAVPREIAVSFLVALGTIVYLCCLAAIAIAVFGLLNIWLFHIPPCTR